MEARLAKALMVAGEKQVVSLQATSEAQIQTSLAIQKSLQREIADYKAVAASAVRSSEERQTAAALAARAEAKLAKEIGFSASLAAKADAELAAAAAAAAAEEKSAATIAQEAAQAQIDASVKKISSLKEEIATYKAVAAAAKTGSEEQIAASRLAAKAQGQLAREIGITKVQQAVPTVQTNAATQVQASLAKRRALQEEILAYRELATAATTSSEEQVVAAGLAAKAERALARELGETSGQAKAVASALSASAAEQVKASILKRKALEKEIADYKAVAASATASAEEQVAAANLAASAEARLAREIAAVSATQEIAAVSHAKAERQVGKSVRGALAGSGAFKALGRSLAFASGGFLAFAVGAQGLRSSVDAAVQFQAQMEQIHTQAGASTREVEHMSLAVKSLSGRVGFAPDELAKGLFHLESAGFRGAKALQALHAAAKAAQLGNADLEDTTTALVAVLKSGISGAEDMGKAVGALNAIVGQGNMRMPDLVKSLSTPLLAAGKFAGLSLKQIGAALDVLTVKWGPNSNAATRLAMAINLLSAPTQQAQKQLKSIGIGATQLGDIIRTKGLPAALDLLRKKMEEQGLTATEQGILITRAFGGGKSSGAVKTLIASIQDLKEKEKGIGAGISTFGEKWEKETKTAEFATKRWHASLKTIETILGADLLPILTKAANHFATWLSKTKNITAIQKDFRDALQITGAALKTVWFFAKQALEVFQTFAGIIGGNRRAVEFLIAAWVAYKVAVKAAGDATLLTGLEEIGTTAGVAATGVGRLSTALIGLNRLRLQKGLVSGLGAAVAGQVIPHVIPGQTGKAIGSTVTDVGMGAIAGSFFKRPGAGAVIGLGAGLKKNVPGRTGKTLGNVAEGAGIGMLAGTAVLGPGAGTALGALAGAGVGLAASFLHLSRSADLAKDALSRIGKQTSSAGFAVQRDRKGVQRFRGMIAEDRVSRDNALAARNSAAAEEKAAKGTSQHGAALHRLRAAQAEYMQSISTLKTDLASLGSSLVQLRKHQHDYAQGIADTRKKLMGMVNDAKEAQSKIINVGRSSATIWLTPAQRLAEYIKKMNALGDSLQKSNPKLASVAHRLAAIAIQTNALPDSHTITIYLKTKIIGSKDVRIGPHEVITLTPRRIIDTVTSTKKGDKGGGGTLPPIRTLTIPERLKIEAAKAINQKQDIQAAKDMLSWVNKMLASGRLVGDALIAAYQERRSALDTINSAAKAEKKKAATTSISKLVPPKIRESVSKTAAAFAETGSKTAGERLIKALEAERKWIKEKLASGHLSGNQRVALENENRRISTQIASARKKFIHDHWTIPMKLQVADAKAAAIAALDPDQQGPTPEMVSIAQQVKKAAMAAIKSHSLTMQGLIDAWNAVAAANATLAQKNKGMPNTYHVVASSAITEGLGLSRDTELTIQQRYDQTTAHNRRGSIRRAVGGTVPGSGAGDTVPAMLTPGEIILNRSQQRNLRSMLGLKKHGSPEELFNHVKHLAGGGPVGPPYRGNPQKVGDSWKSHKSSVWSGLGRFAKFMGGLSHRDNINMQADYLALVLRNHGYKNSRKIARVYAFKHDINTIAKERQAEPKLLAMLRTKVKRHKSGGVVEDYAEQISHSRHVSPSLVRKLKAEQARDPSFQKRINTQLERLARVHEKAMRHDFAHHVLPKIAHATDVATTGGFIGDIRHGRVKQGAVDAAFMLPALRPLRGARAALRAGEVGERVAPILKDGQRFTRERFEKKFAFHGTNSAAGRGIEDAHSIRAIYGGPAQKAHAGDLQIARRFIPQQGGTMALVRRSRLHDSGKAIIASKDDLPLHHVLHGVTPNTDFYSAYKQSVLSRREMRNRGASRVIHRAKGGTVPGQGSGDTVPAMLTPGEIVLNKIQKSSLLRILGLRTVSALFDLLRGRSSNLTPPPPGRSPIEAIPHDMRPNGSNQPTVAASKMGAGLSHDQAVTIQERYAQAAAHRGYAPNGPAALGQVIPMNHGEDSGTTIHIDHVDVHGIRNVDELYSQLEKTAKRRSQRRGTR